jgi:endonuclease III related protein
MSELLDIYQRLLDRYGPRHWWPAQTPFEMVVGAILTQNTNWLNVEKALANLRRAEGLTCAAIGAMPREDLEQLLRPSGFFRQKAERLQLFSRYLCERYQGRLERLLRQPLEPLRRELLEQKGIGPETADSILLYAGGHPSFVVDSYTGRLFARLGLLSGRENYAETRRYFMERLPAEAGLYNEYHALIVFHCKQHCRKQPVCNDCPLQQSCRFRLEAN